MINALIQLDNGDDRFPAGMPISYAGFDACTINIGHKVDWGQDLQFDSAKQYRNPFHAS